MIDTYINIDKEHKNFEDLLKSSGVKKLVIKNIGAIDPKTNLIEVCSYCEVKHEIWTGSSFEKVY